MSELAAALIKWIQESPENRAEFCSWVEDALYTPNVAAKYFQGGDSK